LSIRVNERDVEAGNVDQVVNKDLKWQIQQQDLKWRRSTAAAVMLKQGVKKIDHLQERLCSAACH
jgi:hypothetical protein